MSIPAWLASTVTPDELEAYEERAAIAEYMAPAGSVSRAKAEKLALTCLLAARKRALMQPLMPPRTQTVISKETT